MMLCGYMAILDVLKAKLFFSRRKVAVFSANKPDATAGETKMLLKDRQLHVVGAVPAEYCLPSLQKRRYP
jgi:UDP:flavonoid glycosyltransferase YjiC (YdhE family)